VRESSRIVVVGAGPAGAAASYFLARAGLCPLLVDRAEFPRDKVCGDAVSPRALGVVEAMGALAEVVSLGFRAEEALLVSPDGRSATAAIPRPPGLPGYVVTVPRFRLDHVLKRRAVEAGARFRRARAAGLVRDKGRVAGVRTEDGAVVEADLVILATGAATPLVREAGLLPDGPPLGMAARRYFEDVADLSARIEIFFDGVDLPGYAWVFPSAPRAANVGIGSFGASSRAPARALDDLIERHPRLHAALDGARATGPARGFPIRIGLPPARLTRPGVLVAGEAAGLVNPLTGEGIDYALESGRLAAEAIAACRDADGALARYDAAARRRFRRLFLVLHAARGLYYNARVLNRIVGRAAERPYLVRTFLDVCFGTAEPLRVVGPRAVFEILRP